jgi:hypothetical protein
MRSSTDKEDRILSSTAWLLICVYLLVAAVSVLETGFAARNETFWSFARVCLVALLHGLGWPVRMALGDRRP